MTSTRGLLGAVALVAALVAPLVGCTPKPSEEACEKAVMNIRRLNGEVHTEADSEQRVAVRSCKAQSSRETAECYMRAQTKEELFSCGGEIAEAVRAAEKNGAGKPGAGKPGAAPVTGTAGSGANDTSAPPPASGSASGPGASSSAPPSAPPAGSSGSAPGPGQ